MTINSSNIKNSVWTLFRDLVKDNVTSVTIKGSGGANTKTVTIPSTSISNSFPDKVFDDVSFYPAIIINSPNISTTPTTFTSREVEGTIEFNIYTNQSEALDKITDLINFTIINNESTLRTAGIFETELDSTDSTHAERGKISVHSGMLVWRFRVEI
jgi:hypothetical protein